MLGDEPVNPEEFLVRRFNPDDASHVVLDEGTGEYQLRSGAFYLRADDVGHSCHRRLVLEANQVPVDLVKNPPTYVGLAESCVQTIRSCDPPWEVRADPWPSGEDRDHPEDVAHSLIVPPIVPPKRAQTRRLVACFGILTMS